MTDTPGHIPAPAGTKLELRRVLLDAGPPSAAHNFGWARVGAEVVLEVGYFDLSAIHAAVQKSSETSEEIIPVDWFITNRFVMSLDAAERLVEIVQLLKADLQKLKRAIPENT